MPTKTKAAEPLFAVEMLDPRDLKAHPGNWRLHPERQVEALASSIAEHGWLATILWNRRTGNILDGHARVEEALRQNAAAVPVRVIDVPEAQEKRILAQFDHIGELRESEDVALAALLRELAASEKGLPPGRTEDELGDLLLKLAGDAAAESGLLPDADPDAIPENAPTRCKPGDLWLLGGHKLLCGDSTNAEDVTRLMGGETPSVMVTDPPYGMNYRALSGPKQAGMMRRDVEPVVGDDEPFDPMPAVALANCREVYLWGGDWFYDKLPPGGSWIVWDKRASAEADSIPGAPFEVCWSANRHARRFIRVPWGGWYSKERGDAERLHPTQKPVEVMAHLLRSHEGDVYDPFLGSGTTLIAAEQLGRRCFGLEIEPKYCDVILARWEAATGREAVLSHAHAP